MSSRITLPCILGWSCLLLLIVTSGYTVPMLVISALFACGALLLLLTPAFPHRKPALIASWVGPSVLVGGQAVIARLATDDLVAIALVNGASMGLFMVWLWRYYGIVVLLAIPSKLPSSGLRFRRLADAYPPRWWWIVAFAVMLYPLLLALAIQILTGSVA